MELKRLSEQIVLRREVVRGGRHRHVGLLSNRTMCDRRRTLPSEDPERCLQDRGATFDAAALWPSREWCSVQHGNCVDALCPNDRTASPKRDTAVSGSLELVPDLLTGVLPLRGCEQDLVVVQ